MAIELITILYGTCVIQNKPVILSRHTVCNDVLKLANKNEIFIREWVTILSEEDFRDEIVLSLEKCL